MNEHRHNPWATETHKPYKKHFQKRAKSKFGKNSKIAAASTHAERRRLIYLSIDDLYAVNEIT
jgi:hypothetical protein